MRRTSKPVYCGKPPISVGGYTLAELLVSIAVVGILAAILVPTLAKAKMRSRQAKCMNNMKQLGFAFLSYGHDNNSKTVPYEKKNGNSGWVGLMKSYGVTDQVLHCPMCYKNNKHSMGGMRKDWRVGTIPGEEGKTAADSPDSVVVAKDESAAPIAGTINYPGMDWARHPNYWRLKVGNFGRGKEATFQLRHACPGCSEHKGAHNPHCQPRAPYKDPCYPHNWITPPPCPPPDLSPKSQGGSTVVLVMCENVKPSGFALKISDAKTGKRIDSRTGTSVDDWELFEWSGPLANALGGDGSLLSPSNPYHKKPIGFEQANPLGRHPLNQGRTYPSPPDGSGPVNYIYMRTTIRSSVDQTLNIAVTGDDAYSVFLLDPVTGKT
ncbi:MAG: type II secretion system protein [Verrucomicrobiota bacterium]|nr:type II secretion system protein [Verrucomicrobiota bacterium]